MIDYYYQYDKDGDLIPHEYTRGDFINNIKSTLPMGRYVTTDGLLIRTGNAHCPSHYAGSDSLGVGAQGIFNPADGKTYDSRAAYYNAVKAKGLVIAGDEAPTQRAAPKTRTVNWEKAVAETLKKTPLKGKRK